MTSGQTEPATDGLTRELRNLLLTYQQQLNLEDAVFNSNFPVTLSSEGELLLTKMMLVSKRHGVLMFAPVSLVDQSPESMVIDAIEDIEELFGEVIAKLAKRKETRDQQTNTHCAIYAPHLKRDISEYTDITVLRSSSDVMKFVNSKETLAIDQSAFSQLLATLEMSSILKIKKHRNLQKLDSKGRAAAEAEFEIATFDRNQVDTFVREITGPERVKGLAGSGKTVVLAVKAAIIHAIYPEKILAFTYTTKSLFQHVTRLITDFHQGIAEKEPNWENLRVMHAWGGKRENGFYYEICTHHQVKALTFGDVKHAPSPYNFVCNDLLRQKPKLEPIYDYVFVDEGQDFPNSFFRMALQVAHQQKIIWSFDALQNIFDAKAPRAEEIFQDDLVVDVDDHALTKAYRNPGEILVTAHALGFGIYEKIVQILENEEYWNDLGYTVTSGELIPGSTVVLTRPAENSLRAISNFYAKEDLVQADAFSDIQSEIDFVVRSIKRDISEEELRPDDIMVVCVETSWKTSERYLNGIEAGLRDLGIESNNLWADQNGGREFYRKRHVTLSTVRRAKGNEGNMVYVVGVDSLFEPCPTVVSRNTLFTAMTRAKGWVHVTGIGTHDSPWKKEIEHALKLAPSMKFVYPSREELTVIERELQKGRKLEKRQEKLARFLDELSDEELDNYVELRRRTKNRIQQYTDSRAEQYRNEPTES